MNRVANKRAMAAFVIVAALVFAAPALDAALGAVGVVDAASDNRAIIDSSLLAEGSDPEGALSRIESAVANTSDVPTWFQEEVGMPSGARDVRVDGSVVGYVVDEDEEQALENLSVRMEAKGWTRVPLGGVTGATFLRESGAFTWMLVTCTQVGSATSVVARCS